MRIKTRQTMLRRCQIYILNDQSVKFSFCIDRLVLMQQFVIQNIFCNSISIIYELAKKCVKEMEQNRD